MIHTLRNALHAIASAIDAQITLAQTIASMERDLAHAVGATSVTIALADADRHVVGADVTFALTLDGRSLGTIAYVFPNAPGDALRECLAAIVSPLSIALGWRTRTSERDRLHAQMRTDPLTDLANRMAFDERLDAAWQRSHISRKPLTLALLDVDYFKIYNDMYGHPAGDDCLRQVARVLAGQSSLEGGFVARYGGEEFAFVIEDTDEEQAIPILTRIARVFEERPILHRGSTLGRISLCIGIAARIPSGSNTIADFIRDADRSLYRAKALGRNRICAGEYVSKAAVASRNARTVAAPPVFDDATVGRENDLARILSAMRQARMISLVGPAGIGKSRLAALVGSSAQQTVNDGVAYVDFSMFSSDFDPADLIGTALDLIMEAGDARAELCDAIREREILLILDNVEESSARLVAGLCDELLMAAPALSILATSRASLGSGEERVMVVTPLHEDATLELLRLRSGSNDVRMLRDVARKLEGNPAAVERASRERVAGLSAVGR